MKINKQNKNNKEVSIIYGDDNSINVNIFNNKILMEIVGSFDNNLKELEKVSGSKIYFRGNSIAIKGDKHANEKVKNAIEYLIERFKLDNKIEPASAATCMTLPLISDTPRAKFSGTPSKVTAASNPPPPLLCSFSSIR